MKAIIDCAPAAQREREREQIDPCQVVLVRGRPSGIETRPGAIDVRATP
jgi:hypothetical protein